MCFNYVSPTTWIGQWHEVRGLGERVYACKTVKRGITRIIAFSGDQGPPVKVIVTAGIIFSDGQDGRHLVTIYI